MVDSRKGGVMADRLDDLTDRVEKLETTVREGFKAVDEGFAEQRKYTEFAYSRLDTKMDAGFAKMDERFATMDGSFSRLERKLDQFIDTQSKTNALVERRLKARERRG